MGTEAEKIKLQSIRADLAKVGSDWYIESDDSGQRLLARDPVDNEPRAIAELPIDLPFPYLNFLMRAAESQAFILELLDRCGRAYRSLAGPPEEPQKAPNYATECAMKCANDRAFRQYLIERHQLTDASDIERIKTRVRSILDIASMKELNDNETAAQRWISLRRDFTAWRTV
jgi:hypothetical protein